MVSDRPTAKQRASSSCCRIWRSRSITFTSASGFKGTASFEYTVCNDGTTNGVLAEQGDTATVAVTVQPLIVGNNAAFGGGSMSTLNLATGVTTFVPAGAAVTGANGRGIAVRGVLHGAE
jgi:hypothetical protein